MSANVYGRRMIRRIEREILRDCRVEVRIVHASTLGATTITHDHYVVGEGGAWTRFQQQKTAVERCGFGASSCRLLFGSTDGGGNVPGEAWFMRGRCDVCGCGECEPHFHDCDTLAQILSWGTVSPDYWPVPVHQPRAVALRKRAGQ